MFIDNLAQFLQNILIKHKNNVILGYSNLHLETDDPDAMSFSDFVDTMGLITHVNIPTHKAGLNCFRQPGYDLWMLSINRINVTKFLDIHTDSKLQWHEHVNMSKKNLQLTKCSQFMEEHYIAITYENIIVYSCSPYFKLWLSVTQ